MLGTLMEKNPLVSSFVVLILTTSLSVVTELNPLLECVKVSLLIYKSLETKFFSIIYLLYGASVIDKAYIKSNGLPFQVTTPGRRYHMVTSLLHIEEINRAPLDVLSLHAVAKDFLQPKDTMHGFEWKDVRGVEGTGFVCALRTILTGDRYVVPLYEMCKTVITRLNCSVFFGKELAEDRDSTFAAELIRLLPKAISRFTASYFTRNYTSSATNDGLQWLIDRAPKKNAWSIDRLVGEVMGVWYGSLHTLSIAVTFALLDLYSHPSYITPLRAEISSTSLADFNTPSATPLLDNFLSESARLSAFESTGVRRQALQTFTPSDGLRINRGEWVCIPHRSMMRDDSNFADALTFDGFRFLKDSGRSSRDSYTADASDKWLIWGIGRILCPGRFYASAVLKLMVLRMLLRYDCELPQASEERSFQWGSTVMPKGGIMLVARERGDGEAVSA
ncbi:cytochrome P450 [Zopfia rhizophila CBS 207.26]|uniref:Cytochrome P450 n=1 Tax=Zopfia rhizophila CBS 207.26 TaxID=1314779 RepID=A0A6A6DGA4_9PEZI|nr:cytochrome P450 [Zopfia rhizophila CBS 207.26]